MWFKYGLKAQKLLAQGDVPWVRSFCPFRACEAYMRNLNN